MYRLGQIAAALLVALMLSGCGLDAARNLTGQVNVDDDQPGGDTPAQVLPDSDGDGVSDNADACPDTPQGQAVDEAGCPVVQPDADSDGVPDAVDECPDTTAGAVVDNLGCPIDDATPGPGDAPDTGDDDGGTDTPPDDDGDGVANDDDQCPETPSGSAVDENGCAPTQLDSDGDGVTDDRDRCPHTATGVGVDNAGCPVSGPGSSSPGIVPPPCTSDAACADDNPCTVDECQATGCVNTSIPGCVECTVATQCPPIDVVFIMDTSGSMADEAAALCADIGSVVDELAALDVVVNTSFLGITQTPGGPFSCLTDNVVNLLGATVPGDLDSCPFPDTLSAFESWGPATAIVAKDFPWNDGSLRVIVPITDEGPCDGSLPGGCNDPGDDRDSVANAVAVANEANVIVSPITGTSSDACTTTLAGDLADGTGGIAFHSQDPQVDLAGHIYELLLDACVPDPDCDDEQPCTENDTCIDGVCVGTPIPGCAPCDISEDCDDGNACTQELCNGGVCEWTTIPDCAPCATGADCDDGNGCTEDICSDEGVCEFPAAPDQTQCTVDGFSCTDDVCIAGACEHPALDSRCNDNNDCINDVCDPDDPGADPFTGCVNTPADEQTPCDDGEICTNDNCDGNGACVGTQIDGLECVEDADCYPAICEGGYCACIKQPELRLSAGSGNGCYEAGDEIVVTVELGFSVYPVANAQFFLAYDPSAMQIAAGVDAITAEPPFRLLGDVEINEIDGTVFLAITIDRGAQEPLPEVRGPATLATIRFIALTACTESELCFLDEGYERTILTDSSGEQIQYISACTGSVFVSNGNPQLTCPDGAKYKVDADPGRLSALVTWDPVTAVGGCGEPLPILPDDCTVSNLDIDTSIDLRYLAASGGFIPLGLTEFECTVTDACGATATCGWSVTVNDANLVTVDVQLAPPIVAGPLHRCIEFEFFSSCAESPVTYQDTITFGFPFDLPGCAHYIQFKIPAGKYTCVTARDPLHTLRATAELEIDGSSYVAQFGGDPLLGGNWLLAGNLDDNNVIDILDYARLSQQLGVSYGLGDTPCGTSAPHADLNGDGMVDALDESILLDRLPAADDGACCPFAARAKRAEPIMEISIRQLRTMGLGHLQAADLNHDGVLNLDDVAALRMGVSPHPSRKERERASP